MNRKLFKHTVGMLYFTGALEATSDVRSVPLGAKRKRGRPKKLPNCLARSPVRPDAEPENDPVEPENDLVENGFEPEIDEIVAPVNTSDVPVKKTTRKRKRLQEDNSVQQSPVWALLGQSRNLLPGLGVPKPPKKTRRLPITSAVSSVASAVSSNASQPAIVNCPPYISCTKRKGSCNHEVVFNKHYNKSMWKKYAESVSSRTSAIDIDPNYLV